MTPRIVTRASLAFIPSLLILTLSGFVPGVGPPAHANGDDDVSVTVQPWPTPTVERYDPDDKPDDIPDDEDGRAISQVRVSEPTYQATADANGKITITAVGGVTVDARSTIKVPEDAGDTPTQAEKDLLEHEEGHDTLSKKEYDKRAEEKAKAAFRGLKGMMFQGEGATQQDKINDAKAKAAAEIKRRAVRARESILDQIDAADRKFDRLTDHGTGTGDGKEKDADGKIKPVTTEVGLDMVTKERNRAPDAGKTGMLPDTRAPYVVAPGVPVLTDPAADLLSFGGPIALAAARDPDDPILDDGVLEIDPMRLIGLDDNGNALLADTELRILDGIGGPALLDGYLLEIALMPSTDDDFEFMIQGYLDIPPPFADGIDPEFESEFLEAMLRFSASGPLTMFWLFLDSPLVDGFGNLLPVSSGLAGTAVLATVPAPTAIWLFLPGVVLALGFAARRRAPAGD